jgi:hypothetical protein
VVGWAACPIGCSSHPGAEWDSVARLGVVVARIVVGSVEGQVVLEGVVHFLSLSSI